MKILRWNYQGLNNPLTVRTLNTCCWRERPQFVFIMESLMCKSKLKVVRDRCSFRNGLCVDCVAHSGGIDLW